MSGTERRELIIFSSFRVPDMEEKWFGKNRVQELLKPHLSNNHQIPLAYISPNIII